MLVVVAFASAACTYFAEHVVGAGISSHSFGSYPFAEQCILGACLRFTFAAFFRQLFLVVSRRRTMRSSERRDCVSLQFDAVGRAVAHLGSFGVIPHILESPAIAIAFGGKLPSTWSMLPKFGWLEHRCYTAAHTHGSNRPPNQSAAPNSVGRLLFSL
jgi:hypothetical protein